MKLPRLLLCLLAAVALALPPIGVHAAAGHASAAVHADMECPHHAPAPGHGDSSHGDANHGDAKSIAQNCCPSAPFGWAVMAAGAPALAAAAVDRSPRAGFALQGFISAKDPPPPRV